MLQRLRTLAAAKVNFAFETTLSSRTFALFLANCKAQGYQVHIYYVALPSAALATQRVALRVKLGGHKGFPYYTIGQRKGLEIALGKPAYVLKINPQKNTVMLGDAEQLKAGYMLAEEENLIDEAEFFGSEELTVRIRYRSKPIPCTVKRLEDGRLLVRFLSEASAIAPGQSAVFYVGRRVVGGSFIASQRGIGMYIAENNKNTDI